ncbi:PREDICTED: 39S ribosomal protein L55, mitochondrial [Dinoponera quadriceps]|uniref:39S ribosomal protein L55, mitochondrial n=1 Tax=Dinoponera quadriceps TaxID=609295 RepID=A0A6P3XNY3_DINQU|nr:PREDICTED: 39S ribosomal protein L55, mitochondrial [Dinoponera quadriceps]
MSRLLSLFRCIYVTPSKEYRLALLITTLFFSWKHAELIEFHYCIHTQKALEHHRTWPPIRRTRISRDSLAQPAQSLLSRQVVYLVGRTVRMSIASLARIGSSVPAFSRNLNCWTAAITKKHRRIYERTYPTTLVFSDGSSIEIDYHEPRKIIILPLNLAELTEEQQKARFMMRKPKTKIVIDEEIEDSFDENRYLNFKK